VLNPQTDATWLPPESAIAMHAAAPARGLRAQIVPGLRALFSQRRRNRGLDLLALLRCPRCQAEKLAQNGEAIVCAACRAHYPVRKGVPHMVAERTGT
jgi:uncharacterized protein YbaR (Trm112 family)